MTSKLVYSDVTEKIIGCAIQVHKTLGPGFLEKFYEEALCVELALAQLKFERQQQISLRYRGRHIGHHRIDLIVEETAVVELKAVKEFEDIHFATTLSYLKASQMPVGLLLNFNAHVLAIKRFGNTIFKLNAESRNFGNAEMTIEFLRNNS